MSTAPTKSGPGVLMAAGLLAGWFAAGIGSLGELSAAEGSPVVFGLRGDAPPFSYCVTAEEQCPEGGCALEIQDPDCPFVEGYTARLCREVRDRLAGRGRTQEISYRLVGTNETSGEGRFSLLASSEISILCGATTLSLERMRTNRASLLTFVSGASAIHRRDFDLDSRERLKNLRVGVLAGTTTFNLLERLRGKLEEMGEEFEIVALDSHTEAPGCLAVEEGGSSCPAGVDVYFADREILLWLIRDSKMAPDLSVSERFFSREPYAIFIAEDRPDLVHEVNATLVELFRDPARLDRILRLSFGKSIRSEVLDTLFRVQLMPDR